jgi:molybdenum cofactor biosynthesis protein B
MGSNSSQQHKAQSDQAGPAALAIVTVSDSRTPETEVTAHFLHEQIAALGHRVVAYQIVPDEPKRVTAVLHQLCETEARLILFNGGTGTAPHDTTFPNCSYTHTVVPDPRPARDL